ncbi:hypothetical protein LCGC14_1716180 [marine sediment metagenome]|uniref:Uncharacterized protein n=1 Tax=marine sediment metagenome TaxID=412755 RepID=A0A0F9HE15_9ZZZZ
MQTSRRLIIISCIVWWACMCDYSYASEYSHDDYRLARAIYFAEGGLRADYLFGIRSVNYDTPREAWEICLRTIANQRIRHAEHTHPISYLDCLAKRYAPIRVPNDPHNLNRHWKKNVLFYLKEEK